ncbi:unnamed protein product [Urochloa humidicola]
MGLPVPPATMAMPAPGTVTWVAMASDESIKRRPRTWPRNPRHACRLQPAHAPSPAGGVWPRPPSSAPPQTAVVSAARCWARSRASSTQSHTPTTRLGGSTPTSCLQCCCHGL